MGDEDRERMRETGKQPGQPGQPGARQSTWDPDGPRDWEQGTTDLEQGDMTRPAQPDGTTPLERDMPLKNQKR